MRSTTPGLALAAAGVVRRGSAQWLRERRIG